MSNLPAKTKMAKKSTLPKKASPVTLAVPHDDFNGGFMHVIHQLYFSIQKHLEQALVTHKELSFSQFMILVGFFCEESSSLTQAKLAQQLMLTEATVSRHIRILVAKKFLYKEKDIHNKKSYKLSISPLGKKAFMDAKKIITQELDICFSHITNTDKTIIIKNFTKTITLLHNKK